MIVLMEVQKPYDEGIINVVIATGNDSGGVDFVSSNHDLDGVALTTLIVGDRGDDDEPSEIMKKITEYAKDLMDDEEGIIDVCEKM